MTHTGYDPSLVALSIAIAVLASYTALDLGGRVRGAAPAARWGWTAAASLAMGGGIWAMHFVGMLAFEMAMPVLYGVRLTALSFAIAVGATGAAFAFVSRPGAVRRDVLVSGPLMGVGVAAMHYTGMVAMEIPGDLAFSPPVVALSVLIAVTAATAALWLTTRENDVWQKAVAAGVMGLAVAGMHYTGMAAATFTAPTEGARGAGMAHAAGAAGGVSGGISGGVGLGQQNLALYVAGATFAILFLGMFASALDQQRVGRALHAGEERFRAAAEAVGDIIWTTDPAGRMHGAQVYWRRFTGQTEAECEGLGWTAAIHPDDLAPTLAAWTAAVDGRRAYGFEQRLRRHDGAYRLCSIRALPVLGRDGAVREWVGVHEDITERREAEEALRAARDAAEEASRAKSAFLANMSHELRTPLTAIIGYGEMLKEEMEDGAAPAELAPDMDKVQSNARHLLGIINDVLDLSKVESGKMDVFAERFDVAAMVGEVATAAEALVARKNNRLVVVLPPAGPGAPGLGTADQDVVKLRQVLLNLVSNAAKFTEGGTVTLSAERQTGGHAGRHAGGGIAGGGIAGGGDQLVFRVADTGIGMTPDHLARLFQRFVQADESTTRRFGGTGLGLALSRAFGAMVGGELSVESAFGRGTTFTFRVPAALPAALPVAGARPAAGTSPAAGASPAADEARRGGAAAQAEQAERAA